MDNREYIVDNSLCGSRLDVFISGILEEKSRSYIKKLINDEKVIVNGNLKKSNYKVKVKDIVKIEMPDAIEYEPKPEPIPLDILYEDGDIIVVNKPQGMVVHPASGVYSGTLVNAVLNHCSDLSKANGIMRPGIVHRIDKDTSGVLVIAKNDESYFKLAEQLKDHSMTRIYVALVEGIIKEDEGTISANVGRHPTNRVKIAVVESGKEAVTHYKVLERFKEKTLVQCKLETGRTHQIRVHMAYIGHPLVGDPVYGYKKQKFNLKGQMLHAKKLGFVHPKSGEYIEFDTELPQYFEKILSILKKY